MADFQCSSEGLVTSDKCYSCFQRNKRADSRVLCKNKHKPMPMVPVTEVPDFSGMEPKEGDPVLVLDSVGSVFEAYRKKGLLKTKTPVAQ